jgi:uncharacterized membrane protein
MFMIRWIMWTIAGIVLGGVVHLTTVLYLPRTATNDAYSRHVPITTVNTVVPLPQPGPNGAVMPFMDPSFATAVCRYDLSEGPLKLSAPVSQAYTSVSFFTRYGSAFYAITDRAAGRRTIELDLMTEAQRKLVPEEEDVTSADRLIVDAPTTTGLILIRTLIPEPSLISMAQRAAASAKCQIQKP